MKTTKAAIIIGITTVMTAILLYPTCENSTDIREDCKPVIKNSDTSIKNISYDDNTIYIKTAKVYILYREERSKVRDKNSRLMKTLNDMVVQDAKDNDTLRENANVDGNTPMGSMLKYGSETAKEYVKMYMLRPEIAKAHAEGDIHIHDMDFYPTGTTTCSQIDLTKLFENGFSTGHGFLRKPNSIASYAALTAIAIQANQNDQHGGQSIPNLDRMLTPGIMCSFKKNIKNNLVSSLTIIEDMDTDDAEKKASELISEIEKTIEFKLKNKLNIISFINKSGVCIYRPHCHSCTGILPHLAADCPRALPGKKRACLKPLTRQAPH